MTSSSLRQFTLFAGFSDAEIRTLESHMTTRRLARNVIVMSEGDKADSLYLVLEGRLRVYVSDHNGRELVLNQLGPGDYFGELALFSEGTRSASVITQDACRLKSLSKADFDAALNDNPEMTRHLFEDLAFKVITLTRSMRNMALLDVYGRVSNLLQSMATRIDGRWQVMEQLTQQEIADRVGASRERVSHVLKSLRAGGLISIESGRWVLADRMPHTF